ncbi:MAG: sulfotransferase family 2 domain-containing protein [Chloroflexota bacterium]
MIDRGGGVLSALRRRYRQAQIGARLRRDSERGLRDGVRVVHMLHVRKTGGTAVKAALEGADVPVGMRLLLHGHGISLRDVPANDDIFLFLRDPVARFLSGFDMRRREGRPRHYRPWTTAERRVFERYGSAQDLALALGSSTRSARTEAERAMRNVAHLRSHLGDWLGDERQVHERQDSLIFIGWQEQLDSDFAALVALLGIPPETHLPSDAYAANRADDDATQKPLSADAIEIIRSWYAEDYRLIDLLVGLGLTHPPSAE